MAAGNFVLYISFNHAHGRVTNKSRLIGTVSFLTQKKYRLLAYMKLCESAHPH